MAQWSGATGVWRGPAMAVIIEGPIALRRRRTTRRGYYPATGRRPRSAARKSSRRRVRARARISTATGRLESDFSRARHRISAVRSAAGRYSHRAGGIVETAGRAAETQDSKASSPEPSVTRERKTMSGRPVQLLTAAAFAAAASLCSRSPPPPLAATAAAATRRRSSIRRRWLYSYAASCNPCGGGCSAVACSAAAMAVATRLRCADVCREPGPGLHRAAGRRVSRGRWRL